MSVHNKAHYIKDILERLKIIEPKAELVLIDDGSTDGSGQIMQNYADIFIRTENIWEVKANNVGLKNATGDLIAIIQDDDLILNRYWLTDVVKKMSDNNIAILSGSGVGRFYFKIDDEKYINESFIKLLQTSLIKRKCEVQKFFTINKETIYKIDIFWNGNSYILQQFNRIINFINKQIIKKTYNKNINIIKNISKSKIYEVDVTIRSPFIITKELINDIGYFNEDFAPLGYDDHEFCMRAKQKGYKIAFTFIPHISRYNGGSKWLYKNEEKKRLFDESLSKNKKLFSTLYYNNFRIGLPQKIKEY